MPARNVVKNYLPGSYYHIYNSGFEDRNIFLDSNDFAFFAKLLEKYLSPSPITTEANGKKHTSQKVDLIAYCLMPNHFHLMLKLKEKEGATELMRKILTSYVMYFNKKYQRTGSIFRGKPKGVAIEDQNMILHLTRFIHEKPKRVLNTGDLKEYDYSSYKDYLGLRKNLWVKHEEILKFFRSARKAHEGDALSYESFVENPLTDSKEKLGHLALE